MSNNYRTTQPLKKVHMPVVQRGVIKVVPQNVHANRSTKNVVHPKPVHVPAQDKKLPTKKQEQVIRQEVQKVVQKKPVNQVNYGQHKIAPKSKPPIQDANYHQIAKLKNCGVGKSLVMIACGPSVLEVDFAPIIGNKNLDFMVINKPFQPVWPPRYWAFCDNSQYIRNVETFNSYNNGTIITSSAVPVRKNNMAVIRAKQGHGFSKDLLDGYIIGRSSVYANMQTALWMNYDNVFIFGVDMCEVNGSVHFYGINPDVDPKVRVERFSVEAKFYTEAGNTLPEQVRKKYYFCSSYNKFPFTALFNKVDHKNAIDLILKTITK